MLRLLCLVVLVVCISADVSVKNLAGPPSEFSDFAFPDPFHSADVQNSATFYVKLIPSSSKKNVVESQLTLTVDSDKEFSFVFYSPFEQSVTLSLKNPDGLSLLLNGVATDFPVSDGTLIIKGTEYTFKDPKSGDYILTMTSSTLSDEEFAKITSNKVADAYVLLWNEDSLATHTALNSYSLLTGSKIGLVSRVFTGSFSAAEMKQGKAPTAIRGSVTAAEMTVVFPDGETIDKPMTDDGLASDGAAGDGIYGSLITAPVAGQYIFSATLQGKNSDGVNYIRTTQQLVTVVDPTLTLTGTAQGALDHAADSRMNIYLGATAPAGNKYKAFTEVWGTDSKGNIVPVAWLGGMAFVEETNGVSSLVLELDLNWLSMAGAQEPLVLKNVVIQDVNTFVPIAQAAQIAVKASSIALRPHMATLELLGKNGEITEEMREGIRPAKYSLSSAPNTTADSAAVILVHGYCTNANPFLTYPADWTNAYFFTDFDKNYPHDTFALNVIKWAESYGPYSYVGHSQGGAVGLHIKNYYWSGMDQVTGGRLLQSVGTPYQGSGGAGTAADLANMFGVLCGKNQDLTRDGAELWLNGVTPQNRKLVNYYTSTYVQGKFFGDYCNLATNIVLAWPNDGVTEYEYAQLPGAQYQGNVEGWCHSVKMKYPPQSENQDRNKIMNAEAARQIKK